MCATSDFRYVRHQDEISREYLLGRRRFFRISRRVDYTCEVIVRRYPSSNSSSTESRAYDTQYIHTVPLCTRYRNVNAHTIRLRQESLIFQNVVAPLKTERISSTLGRTSRFPRQHSSTVLHSLSLNPRRLAPSGFSGRIPLVIMRMTVIPDWVST